MDKSKKYYSVQELVAEDWFPIKSVITLKKLIENKKINAIDISTNDKMKQYKISKEEIIKFLGKEE